MPDPLSGLPKFPEESRTRDAAEMKREATHGEAEPFWDWLRHAWPALTVTVFAAAGFLVLIVVMTWGGTDVLGGTLEAVGAIGCFVAVCAELGWRFYRRRGR